MSLTQVSVHQLEGGLLGVVDLGQIEPSRDLGHLELRSNEF